MDEVFLLKHKFRYDDDFELVGVFTDKDNINKAKLLYIKLYNEHKTTDHVWLIIPIKLNKIDI